MVLARLVGWSVGLGYFVRACVGSFVRALVRWFDHWCVHALISWLGWLVGLVGWVGWLVGWVGWCVRACMSFVHPFALSFGRSLSTSLSLSISLLLPISLTRGSVIAQLGARVSRYTAASWVLSNAGPRQALRQPGILCASAPVHAERSRDSGQARRKLVVQACRVGC